MSKFDRCVFIFIGLGIWALAMTQVFKPSNVSAFENTEYCRDILLPCIVDFAVASRFEIQFDQVNSLLNGIREDLRKYACTDENPCVFRTKMLSDKTRNMYGQDIMPSTLPLWVAKPEIISNLEKLEKNPQIKAKND